MYQALKRRNYVTPTSYLETVHNYRTLLAEKRSQLAGKANKLKGGLTKLDETRIQVEFEGWRCQQPRLSAAAC
jgi:dynein heavy chain